MADLIEVASRVCQISGESDQEPSPLKIAFYAPEMVGEDEFRATASLKCKYFEKDLSAVGVDSIQALLLSIRKVHGYLLVRAEARIRDFFYEPGDLKTPAFWGVERLTFERDG